MAAASVSSIETCDVPSETRDALIELHDVINGWGTIGTGCIEPCDIPIEIPPPPPTSLPPPPTPHSLLIVLGRPCSINSVNAIVGVGHPDPGDALVNDVEVEPSLSCNAMFCIFKSFF